MIQLVACCICRQLNAAVSILVGEAFPKGRIERGKMQKPHGTENNDPLLDELKESLESGFHKSCVESYLAKPSAAAIAQTAVDALAGAINETK
jgi:hypothetical protein